MSELQRRRRRLRVRWLVAFTCLVVMVDLAAGVLTVVADHRADEARSRVTAGLDYVTNTGNLMQAVLEAESDVRGYVLTGERAYLNVSTTVKTAPTLVKRIRRDSGGDPVLRADYRKLAPLLTARVNDLVATLRPAMKGDYAAAVAVVKTNRGKQITAQIRALTQAMVARSNQLVNRERASSQNSQVLAGYASIVAYGASGLLLVMMALLLRGYMQADQERRASMRAQVEAERLSSATTGFLSRVSHELRTPLNAILGFGQLLEREPLDASQRETLDQMLSGGRHLLAIVDDLLDLSRVESNELRLSVEPVQVAEAVQEARALMAHTASAAAVGLRQRAIDDTLFVQADNQRLMQILLNLISNAVKYNRRGGNVVVGASRTPEGMVRVEVADTGYGIAAADIPQLFRPFERLDAARRGIEGTGLGLAVARGLTEAMGGRLELFSQPGQGTTVWFELPASSAEQIYGLRPGSPRLGDGLPAQPTAIAADPGGRGPTVLYIEDNPSNVRLVEKVLALRSEITLHVAREGAAGIALARSVGPSVILLDLHLPDMSGEQVLAALLGDEATAQIPVIILSADASPVQAKRLRAAGAAGYLTKPVDVEQLLDAVALGGTPIGYEDEDELDGALLDPAMVDSLHMLATNPAVGPGQIGQMLSTFRSDSAEMVRTLRQAMDAGDLEVVVREAHRLAGGSGTFGAGRFRLACRSLEQLARNGDVEAVREVDGTLDELLETTWQALRQEFAEELRYSDGAHAGEGSSIRSS